MRGKPMDGASVRLRPIEARDATAMYDLVSDADAMRRLGVTDVFRPEAVA